MATEDGHDHDVAEIVVRYRECRRNHAAPLMSYAVDGCGGFVSEAEVGTPEALVCAACGCHRNFHRREEVPIPVRRRLPRFRFVRRSGLPSPPPRPPSPPVPPQPLPPAHPQPEPPVEPRNPRRPHDERSEEEMGTKKKSRTKISLTQRERLIAFGEKLGWRTARHDEEEIAQFCLENEISTQTFKNWINNRRRQMENGQPSAI